MFYVFLESEGEKKLLNIFDFENVQVVYRVVICGICNYLCYYNINIINC